MARRRSGFARTVKGLEIWLDPEVAAVIRRTAREVQELIASEPAVDGLAGPGGGGEVPPLSEDPALARLFPSAYDDPEQAEEYRRYTYTELHAAKVAGLEQLARQLTELPPRVVLDDDSAQVWLSALNDLRLVIGS